MIVCGDAREVLAGMDAESVHACITSPPYWGLRDYSDAVECVFGGEPDCQHEWGPERIRPVTPISDKTGLHNDGRKTPVTEKYRETLDAMTPGASQGSFCSLCGAWRGQFGLEPTPEMYVEYTLEFLRAIRRVLRKDGVVFWNLGDSYAGSGKGQMGSGAHCAKTGEKQKTNVGSIVGGLPTSYDGLKPKDLVMIPFRVALAAQADGWWVRSVIIWNKPNPMPESVRDRPTTSHEYILLLTKSGESQYWTHRDLDGVRAKPKADYRWVNQLTDTEIDYAPDDWKEIVNCPDCDSGIITYSRMGVSWDDKCERCGGKGEFQLWKRINLWQGHDYFYDADAIREPISPNWKYGAGAPMPEHGEHVLTEGHRRQAKRIYDVPKGRNKRTVWTIATQPYPEAHFATFPEALVEPMILTTPTKCCAECGAGYERIVETGLTAHDGDTQSLYPKGSSANRLALLRQAARERGGEYAKPNRTLGFRPTCSCDAESKPAIILDPFAGRGTVGRKARQHGRDYVLIEMNPDYIPMMKRYLAMADEEVEKQGETWVQPRMDLTS